MSIWWRQYQYFTFAHLRLQPVLSSSGKDIMIPDEEILIIRRQKAQQVVAGSLSVCVCACVCVCCAISESKGGGLLSCAWRHVRKHIHIPTGSDSCVSQSVMARPCVWNVQQGPRNTSVGAPAERRPTCASLLRLKTNDLRGFWFNFLYRIRHVTQYGVRLFV